MAGIDLDPEAALKTLGRHRRRMGEMAMTRQVDNGDIYVSRYCGRTPRDLGSPLRVEVRSGPRAELLVDTTWDEFKEIVRLGQELIEKCEQPDA